jgi:hypothetical protein
VRGAGVVRGAVQGAALLEKSSSGVRNGYCFKQKSSSGGAAAGVSLLLHPPTRVLHNGYCLALLPEKVQTCVPDAFPTRACVYTLAPTRRATRRAGAHDPAPHLAPTRRASLRPTEPPPRPALLRRTRRGAAALWVTRRGAAGGRDTAGAGGDARGRRLRRQSRVKALCPRVADEPLQTAVGRCRPVQAGADRC